MHGCRQFRQRVGHDMIAALCVCGMYALRVLCRVCVGVVAWCVGVVCWVGGCCGVSLTMALGVPNRLAAGACDCGSVK